MATANNKLQIADLDFAALKTSLTQYMKGQDTFKDYNFAGSGMSTLLDVLTYNTQYNAFYLNQVANEMFLDSAIQRSSVISHAKELNYTPKSAISPSATVKLTVTGVSSSSLTLPRFSKFVSEPVAGVNYNFVNLDSQTVNVTANTAVFNNVILKQGVSAYFNYTYSASTNPRAVFQLPDNTIDTTTLQVLVYPNPSVTQYDVYTLADEYLTLDDTSKVYFLQESTNGNYEIYFGDGIIGKQLTDGSKVAVSYISTNGTDSAGANNFVLSTPLGGTPLVSPISAATNGSDKESIASIKFQAPKTYAAQKRAVTEEDYITAIQQNNIGFSFDAVSVWGGQKNPTPVYGQVFISMKPTGGYLLTDTQKQRLINEVIKPISVMTVEPTIVDPDYTYIQITANVLYDPKKTTSTSNQIQSAVKSAIASYATQSLNTFNSTFASTDFNDVIKAADSSIITNELSIQLQKKIFPNLTTPTTYKLYYGAPLKRGMFLSGVSSSPALKFRDPSNQTQSVDGIYIEEIPTSTGGIESISVLNPGFGYSNENPPTVTILGDGTGATATATVSGGVIRSITITNAGTGYTSAIVKITPAANDTTGKLGAAVAILEGRYGTLRSYYNNTENVKTIFSNNVGTIDYQEGIVTLNSFGPIDVDNLLGQFTVSTNPTTTIISSTFNRIITVDSFDPNSIVVNVTAKT